jgi:hypothetical protein
MKIFGFAFTLLLVHSAPLAAQSANLGSLDKELVRRPRRRAEQRRLDLDEGLRDHRLRRREAIA